MFAVWSNRKTRISKQGLNREQTASYEGALEAVFAVPIAIGVGYWADRQLDSAPIGLIVGTIIGFAAMLLRILRMRPRESEAEQDTSKDSHQDSANDRGADPRNESDH